MTERLAVGDNVIKAVVTAEDTTTTKTYMVTVTREATTTTVPVTIEAQHEKIGGGLEDLNFTLTRTGDTTEPLVATVTITQQQSWLGSSDLSHTVTFQAGDATAPLMIEATEFSFTPSTTGDLTATVSGDGIDGGSDTVQIVSTSAPPITVGFDKSAYTFEENTTDEEVYLVATLDAAYPRAPSRSLRGLKLFSPFRQNRARPNFATTSPRSLTVMNVIVAITSSRSAANTWPASPLQTSISWTTMVYEVSEQFLLNTGEWPQY